MRLIQILFLLAPLSFLFACTHVHTDTGTYDEKPLPRTFSLFSEEPVPYHRWWETFENSELIGLIETALSENLSLKEAWARLNQAQALAIKAGAVKYPDLSLTAGASESIQKLKGSSRTSADNYSIGLAGSYELDLWGRVGSEAKAAGLAALASREDLNTAAMTLSAEVAQRWVRLLSQRQERALLDEQLKTAMTLLDLVELRFRNAMASVLDVYQQREAVAGIRALIPQAEAAEILLLNELALLLGKPHRTPLQIASEELPAMTAIPPTGLPADLLAMRPDILAAGLRLRAAGEQVDTARANRLPALSLTAQAAYSGGSLGDIFDNWLINLAANLTAPIFDGKRRKAEVTRTEAVTDERLAAYGRTVLTAIREVEDALVREEKERLHYRALEAQSTITGQALEEARKRYMNGLNDYLPVLTELISLQSVERDLIRSRRDVVLFRIALHRALGGTWMKELQEDDGTEEKKDKT